MGNPLSRDAARRRRGWRTPAVVVVACLVAASCYNYRTHAPGYPGVKEGGETTWSFLWGIFNQEPTVDCNNQALAEVTVVDNFGFTLLTVVTLGIVNPKQIEWKCARANPTDGVLTPPPADSEPATPDSTPAPDAAQPADAGPTDSTGSE